MVMLSTLLVAEFPNSTPAGSECLSSQRQFPMQAGSVSIAADRVCDPVLILGIGILTALTQPSPEALREAIKQTKKLTSKPFGVNITLLPSINPPDYEGYARAAVEEGVRIFETAGNNRAYLAYPRSTSSISRLLVRQLDP